MLTPHQRPAATEAAYPVTYRAHEVAQIMRAVQTRHSSMVCGLGGSGKSHLLRFLAFHPAVAERLPAVDLRRVYLDCNAAIEQDAAGIFRALLREVGAEPWATDAADPLAALRAHLAADIVPATRFMILIDRVERIKPEILPALLDGLRHVRDYLNRRVSYVLGSRTPLPIAQLSAEFDDLLAEPPVVWVGPLAADDAAWNVDAIFAEQGETMDTATRAALVQWSSGHPRLVRAATLAWANRADKDAPLQPALVFHDRQVVRVCEALYNELDEHSQALLRRIANGEPSMVPADHVLRRTGLVHGDDDHQPALASPVFALFLRTQDTPAALELTALEEELWTIMSAAPHIVQRRDDLITVLYGGNNDINDEALTALVARLRRKLSDAHMGTLEAVRGRGYRFIPAAYTPVRQ